MHRCKYFYTTITTLSAIITTYMNKDPNNNLSDELSEQDYLWESLKCLEELAEIKQELAEITAIAQSMSEDQNMKETLEQIEKLAIEKSLESYMGNITHASNALGIGRTNLLAKMKKYEIVNNFSSDASSATQS